MKIGLVCTSIGRGEFLEGYCKKAEEEGLKSSVHFIIIGDKNSPTELYSECEKWHRRGFNVRDPLIEGQEFILSKTKMKNLIPYNSDNRRNVGYLIAYELGCDVIISIDDDNYCRNGEAFFGIHALVGKDQKELSINANWYNICQNIGLDSYARGFPYKQRVNTNVWGEDEKTGYVAVNEGLWHIDPDFDALTWMKYVGKPEPKYDGKVFFLGDKAWSPINSQNTAICWQATVANYFIPMGATISGMKIDHHADIFSGYFLQACVKKMKHKIRIGTPIVDHIRNNHDYMVDLVKEYYCIQMLEDLTEWLHEEKLDGTVYSDCYLSLAERMEDKVEKFTGSIWNIDAKAFIHRTAYCMRQWVKTIKEIGI